MKIKIADSFSKRLKGLMFKKNIDYGLLFVNLKSSGIHTHFMRFEIDVYFIDENKTVFEKATLKPWKFYTPHQSATYILETKKGEIKLKIGDKLDFI